MKKTIACLLTLLLLISVSACGAKQDASSGGDKDKKENAAADADDNNEQNGQNEQSGTSAPQDVVRIFLEAAALGDESHLGYTIARGNPIDDDEFASFSGDLRRMMQNADGSYAETANIDIRIKNTQNVEGDDLTGLMSRYGVDAQQNGVTKAAELTFEAYLNGELIDDDCFATVVLENGEWKLLDFSC